MHHHQMHHHQMHYHQKYSVATPHGDLQDCQVSSVLRYRVNEAVSGTNKKQKTKRQKPDLVYGQDVLSVHTSRFFLHHYVLVCMSPQ